MSLASHSLTAAPHPDLSLPAEANPHPDLSLPAEATFPPALSVSDGYGLLRYDMQRSKNLPVKRTRLVSAPMSRKSNLKVKNKTESTFPVPGYYLRKDGTLYYKSIDGSVSERGTMTQESH